MIEIRWHGRGGQGAKTGAHLFAMAALESERSVQAFPEFGPERSGAPVQAYDRIDERPIRRRDAVTTPDAVVVLDPSLLREVDVAAGLRPGGLLLVNTDRRPEDIRAQLGVGGTVLCVPGNSLAAEVGGRHANVVLLGALAAALGEPPLPALEQAASDLLGEKLGSAALEPALASLAAGYRYLAGEDAGRRVACLA